MPGIIEQASILHAFEGALWAGAYRLLGALPDNEAAMLYSLSAMTDTVMRTSTLRDTGK
jgi:hypothetical protein